MVDVKRETFWVKKELKMNQIEAFAEDGPRRLSPSGLNCIISAAFDAFSGDPVSRCASP